MTCYEALRQEAAPAPAAAADAPMAHHLFKWWRNKFRNGYKKFSVGTESERTDTEELVGRAASQCSAPPDLLPSEARALLQPSASPPPRRVPPAHPAPAPAPPHQSPHPARPVHPPHTHHDKPRLRFEELTCDVQLQHAESSKQQPLQFSFTLYDLDGHGRMTKDDIAGIVSTIYESIGKSVTVPHYGSKTIQVRLTVVPESAAAERRRGGRRRRRAGPPPPDCGDATDGASSCSPARAPRPAPPRAPRPARHTKKRSGSLQRRELLEIIQANMEKNHLSFQTSRKPREHRVIHEEEQPPKHQRLRNRAYTISEKPVLNTFQKAKPEAPSNGYLDLAGPADPNLCRYDRYLHAVICSSAKHAHSGYHQKNPPNGLPKAQKPPKTHVRSRSHDLPPPPPPAPEPRVLQIIFL